MLVQSVDSFRSGPDGFIVDWVRALANKVDRLMVLTYHYNPKEKLPENTIVLEINGKNTLSRNLDLFRKIIVIGRREKIDVILAHILEIFGIAAAVCGKIIGAKSFLWYCQSYDLRRNNMAKLALFLVDVILTCSAEFKDQYAFQVGEVIRKKIIIVGHGIDTSRFKTKPKISFPAVGRPVKIAYAGRLSPIKDIFTMLAATEKLKNTGRNVTFHLYGSWGVVDQRGQEFQSKLLTRIKEINKSSKIIFFDGPKAYTYVQSSQVFKSADLFIMPGLKTLAEILSCGVTTIFPDSYISYVGKNFPQLTYRFGDSDDLAFKLSGLIEDPAQTIRITRLVSMSIKEIFSLDLLMARIVSRFSGTI